MDSMKTVINALVVRTAVATVLLACCAQAANYSLTQTGGNYCFLRPDGKPFMILGLSHASGAWQSDQGALSGEQKQKRLANLKQDLRDLHFNAVGYVPELIGEFAYIHNADRLPGSPGTVSGKGQALQQGKHLYQDVFDPAFKARLRRHICGGVNGCVVRDNYIHDNECKGIWVDVLSCDNIFENNLIEGNSGSGITVEVSLRNVVRNNAIGNNCLWPGYDNAEVYIQSCAFNEMSGNTIQMAKRGKVDTTQTGREREQDFAEASTGMASEESHAILVTLGSRAKPPEGDPDQLHKDCYCHDNKVHGNRIVFLGGTGAAGVIALTPGWESNQFYGNAYHFAPGGEAKRFAWNSLNRRLTFEEFRQKGQEAGGSVSSVVAPLKYEWSWKKIRGGIK